MLKRVVMTLVAFVFTYFALGFASLFVTASMNLPRLVFHALAIAQLACAIGAARWAWLRSGLQHSSSNVIFDSTDQLQLGRQITMGILMLGGIGFIAGFFGPLIFTPEKNLGPMLGIFVTGPIGILAGPLVGIALSIRELKVDSLRQAILYLILNLLLICGLYSFSVSRFMIAAELALILMMLCIAVGTALLVHVIKFLKPNWSVVAYGVVLLFGACAILGMSVLPPVTDAWWVPSSMRSSTSIPSFAFIWDNGFNASRHYPQFTVDILKWQIEILAIIVMALVLCVFVWLVEKFSSKNP